LSILYALRRSAQASINIMTAKAWHGMTTKS
jgi:hypothetical protein